MMPDFTGQRLADEIGARLPGLRVLLVSAHSAEDLIARGTVRPGVALLRKPFDKSELGRRVLEVLDAPVPDSTSSMSSSRSIEASWASMTPSPTPSPTIPSPTASSGATAATILLVDDDQNGRMALAMLLEEEGMQVLAAADPNEALRMATAWSGTIDLLLTDLNMPQMRGDVLARRINALRGEHVELLYVSGALPPDDLDPKAPFVLKPVSFDLLVQQIQSICGLRPITSIH
jgi:CheY-like chemotaxis protein